MKFRRFCRYKILNIPSTYWIDKLYYLIIGNVLDLYLIILHDGKLEYLFIGYHIYIIFLFVSISWEKSAHLSSKFDKYDMKNVLNINERSIKIMK